MTLTSTGTFATENASRYLQQLCKHFGHKVDVDFNETEARLAMPLGPVTMTADTEVLTINVSAADADSIGVARKVIDSHLERFAFREDFKTMSWAD